jgi:dTDP-4-amino-4,6-dideoxygalactose transaminase
MPSNRTQPVYHLYVVECSNRDEARSALSSARIDSGVHYPVPLHRQESFWGHGVVGSPPATDQIADGILSLPLCAERFENEQDRIVEEFLRLARPLNRRMRETQTLRWAAATSSK